MDFWQAALFGLLQGITEFLPVSSSGHLAVMQIALGYDDPESNLMFTLLVHAASLLAVFAYFARPILEIARGALAVLPRPNAWTTNPSMRLLLLVSLSTLVTGIPGLLLKDWVSHLATQLWFVGCCFLATGIILTTTRWAKPREALDINNLLWIHAVLLGLAQLLAIMPGISRSGTTIAVALLLGWPRGLAVAYSFYMAIPAILAPNLLYLRAMMEEGMQDSMGGGTMLIAFAASAVASLAALALLSIIVQRDVLYRFAYYVIPLGVACLALYALGWNGTG